MVNVLVKSYILLINNCSISYLELTSLCKANNLADTWEYHSPHFARTKVVDFIESDVGQEDARAGDLLEHEAGVKGPVVEGSLYGSPGDVFCQERSVVIDVVFYK